jgi:hypothetical protein
MKKRITFIIAFLVVVLFFSGCNAVENNTTSASKLLLHSVLGEDLEDNPSSTAFSDVLDEEGGVINDLGYVSLSAVLLDPINEAPTHYQDIMIDQIDVEYSRTDGQNVQGVDIPYSFSQNVGGVIIQIGASGPTDIPFILVNHNAKLEPPLVGLMNIGQAKILKLEAKITVHGKDLAGHRVEPVVGKISVWCANFGG